MAASIAALGIFGLRPGIDFSGGVAWQIRFTEKMPTREELAGIFPSAIITPQEDGQFLIRMQELTETDRQKNLKGLAENYGVIDELQFQNIGPSVGEDLKQKAVWAANKHWRS